METVIDILEQRGFIENKTHDEELHRLFAEQKVTCYIGFDPTAVSLHVGSLVPIMALSHMQKNGHRPIALVGGGTGLVGDPSGKTEMRKLLTEEDLTVNVKGIGNQLSRFLDFSDDKAVLVNNADWLKTLAYIPMLRDIGRHFSVNRMIKAESYKVRLDSEEGLNFIEFNYMILQAYDFLKLFEQYQCRLQMGGSDQWGNIVAGIDLVRRKRQEQVFGITFPLITTSSGAKMGKTAEGAIWLDPEKTSPYEYYQFWINTDDKDVERFLALFTFLPMEEIRRVRELKDNELNPAKSVLAYEATAIAHGPDAAQKAFEASSSMFGARLVPEDLLPSGGIPRDDFEGGSTRIPGSEITKDDLSQGIPLFKLMAQTGLVESGSSARKLIEQGGAYINGERVGNSGRLIGREDVVDGEIMLRAGKKRYHKIKIRKD